MDVRVKMKEFAMGLDTGKQDILMHHPFTLRDIHGGRVRALGTEPHRVTMLITR